MWKFRDFLPVDITDKVVSAGEGDTPLRKLSSFQGNVWVKDETKNPTGTFKDRGASLAVTALSALSSSSFYRLRATPDAHSPSTRTSRI